LILLTLSDGAFARRIIRHKCQVPAWGIVESSQAEPSVSDLASLVPKRTPQVLETLESGRGGWPYSTSLESLAAKTKLVVAATATGPVKLGKSYSAHISTQMNIGDRVIRGGGFTTTTECRQEFQVTEVLQGKARLEKREVDYSIMDSRAFPGPASTRPIPAAAKAILLFGKNADLLKAIEDTPENRRAVKDALSPKKAAPK
jgi:hypothetical protein